MPTEARIQQGPEQVVSLEGWQLDEEFPYGPQGAKAKRIVICPSPPPYGFLIGGHRYLFKEPAGAKAQQIWSEVIAYEVGREVGVTVPPAFLATGPGNGSPGVLIEFFYGYQYEPQFRFVHAIERLQGMQFAIDFDRGSLRDNLQLCRAHTVPNWRTWWSQTLAFDALIGNVDRHSENWGFLTIPGENAKLEYRLAPAFDNGTSMGFIVRDQDLKEFLRPERLQQLVRNGKHHFGWLAGDHASAQHAELCRLLNQRIAGLRDTMRGAISLDDSRIEAVVSWCRRFNFPLPFVEARGEFVAAQLRARRDAVSAVLGV